MVRISFHLRRPAHMTFGQNTVAKTADRHRRGKKERLARYHFLRLPHVRHNLFVRRRRRRTQAAAQAGQSQRSAHDLQKFPTIERVQPDGSVPRKLSLQEFFEIFGVGQFFQTAPVLHASNRRKSSSDEIQIHQPFTHWRSPVIDDM